VTVVGKLADFSVTAEAGTGSAFCVTEVVTLMVLGRGTDDSDAFEMPVPGVSGRELMAEGVAATEAARTGVCCLAGEIWGVSGFLDVAAEMSNFARSEIVGCWNGF
jgi:hypothetical protein